MARLLSRGKFFIATFQISTAVLFGSSYANAQELSAPEGSNAKTRGSDAHSGVVMSKEDEAKKRKEEAEEKIKAAQKKMEERRIQSDKEAKERRAEQLSKALEKFQQAKIQKNSNKSKYLNALLNLVYAYSMSSEVEKSNKLFLEGVDYYVANADSIPQGYQGLFRRLQHRNSSIDKTIFLRIWDAAERTIADKRNLDRDVADVIRYSGEQNSGQSSEFWKVVLDRVEHTRSKTDKSVARFYEMYAYACDAAGDPNTAEEYFIKSASLFPSDVYLVTNANLNLARLYLKSNQLDKSERAWKSALALQQGSIQNRFDRTFVSLAKSYRDKGRITESDRLLDAILLNANDETVREIDPLLEEIVNGLATAGNFSRQEDLLKKRIAASAKCSNDAANIEWRFRLSDLYLVTGREEESNNLFKEIETSLVLQGASPSNLIYRRMQMLERLGKSNAVAKLRQKVPTVKDVSVTIGYLLFALQELRLGHNTSISAYDPTSANSRMYLARQRPGQNGAGICSLGSVIAEGNFSTDGEIYGRTSSDKGRLRDYNVLPPPEQAIFLPPSPQPSKSSQALSLNGHGFNRGPIASGDYKIADLRQVPWDTVSNSKKIRLFLLDSVDSPVRHEVGHFFSQSKHSDIDLQLFYDGVKTINTGSSFSGIIYAPNATVEIPHNGRFSGAIFANRIIGESNNHYTFDKQLLGVRLF